MDREETDLWVRGVAGATLSYRFSDDSMAPFYAPGSVAVAEPVDVSELSDGEDAVVWLTSGEQLARRVQHCPAVPGCRERPALMLIPANPAHAPRDVDLSAVDAAGRIVAVFRPVRMRHEKSGSPEKATDPQPASKRGREATSPAAA